MFPRPADPAEPRYTINETESSDNMLVLVCGHCRGPNITEREFAHNWRGCHLGCAHCAVTGVMPDYQGGSR